MNKYDGALKYSVVSTAHFWIDWQFRRGKSDALVVELQANRDLRSRGHERIVAWCPTKAAAEAARRLLSGECESSIDRCSSGKRVHR